MRRFGLLLLVALSAVGCGDGTSGRLRTFSGHSAMVCSIAFTPSGKHLISGGADGKIMLWDVLSGQCVRAFDGHTEWVHSVAVSPDGRYIASGGRDNLVKLWDVASGERLKSFSGHLGLVKSVAYSPDGRILASCGRDSAVKLWDIESGDCLKDLGTDNFFTSSVVLFTADSKHLFCEGASLQLWDIETGQCLREFKGHSDSIGALAISRDGKWIASAGRYTDNTVRLWNAESADCVWKKALGENDGAWSLAFTSRDRVLITGRHGGAIEHFDVESGASLRRFNAHHEIVSCLSADATGQVYASGSWDKSIKLWEAPRKE